MGPHGVCSLSRWQVVSNKEKSGEVRRELDSIPEPVGSMAVILSLALWAIQVCLNHHYLDLDTEQGRL